MWSLSGAHRRLVAAYLGRGREGTGETFGWAMATPVVAASSPRSRAYGVGGGTACPALCRDLAPPARLQFTRRAVPAAAASPSFICSSPRQEIREGCVVLSSPQFIISVVRCCGPLQMRAERMEGRNVHNC